MAKPKLIGIVGGIGCGKDTMAAMLAQHGYTRYAFADEIRREIADAIYSNKIPADLPIHLWVAWKLGLVRILDVYRKPTGVVMRELLVWWGKSRCEKDPNFWIDQLFDTMDRRRLCVVSDVRKQREAEAIRSAGGEIWRVIRNDWSTDDTICEPVHADVVIENGSSIYELGLAVKRTIETRGGVRGEVSTQGVQTKVPGLFEGQDVSEPAGDVQ